MFPVTNKWGFSQETTIHYSVRLKDHLITASFKQNAEAFPIGPNSVIIRDSGGYHIPSSPVTNLTL